MRQVDGMKVTRLTLGSLPLCPIPSGSVCYRRCKAFGMGQQMTAEAVVAEPIGEGPNLLEKLD